MFSIETPDIKCASVFKGAILTRFEVKVYPLLSTSALSASNFHPDAVYNINMLYQTCLQLTVIIYSPSPLFTPPVIFIDVDVSIQLTPGLSSDLTFTPNAVPVAAPRQHRAHRSGGTRDDRYRSGKQNQFASTLLFKNIGLVNFIKCFWKKPPHTCIYAIRNTVLLWNMTIF